MSLESTAHPSAALLAELAEAVLLDQLEDANRAGHSLACVGVQAALETVRDIPGRGEGLPYARAVLVALDVLSDHWALSDEAPPADAMQAVRGCRMALDVAFESAAAEAGLYAY